MVQNLRLLTSECTVAYTSSRSTCRAGGQPDKIARHDRHVSEHRLSPVLDGFHVVSAEFKSFVGYGGSRRNLLGSVIKTDMGLCDAGKVVNACENAGLGKPSNRPVEARTRLGETVYGQSLQRFKIFIDLLADLSTD